VLRRIFRPKRDDVTGEWRKLHNKELHDLYSSPSIIRISQGGLGGRGMWPEREKREIRVGYCWESQRERDH
jgi:hypothetical protein